MDKLKPVSVQLLSGVHTFTEALMLSCQILVELSSIPTMGSTTSSPLGYDFSLLGYGCSPQELPGWLKYLIISACLLDGRDSPDVLLESINTFLEIISLHDSNQRIRPSRARGDHHRQNSQENEANFVILMMPLISENQYKCVFKQTVIPQIIASRLWDALG